MSTVTIPAAITSLTTAPALIPEGLIEQCAALHDHVCPRQILGLRIGLYAGEILGLELPREDKRLLTIVETDGCAADGIMVATGCTLGHRTMRLADYGKVAATFVDVETGRAIRLAPRHGVRDLARAYAPGAQSRWHAQRDGYQLVPDEDLLSVEDVALEFSISRWISRPGHRVTCDACGEEIINEREVMTGEQTLCRACAGDAYYRPAGAAPTPRDSQWKFAVEVE